MEQFEQIFAGYQGRHSEHQEPEIKPCPICGLNECEHQGDTNEQ